MLRATHWMISRLGNFDPTLMDTRKKNETWMVRSDSDGKYSFDAAQLCVLMDIRDELQKLNKVFECGNFLAIPATLREIQINTKKKRKVRKK